MNRALLVVMAIVGAVLGFLLEPMIGRLTTLAFGGAVQVWTTVVFVFQTLLLASYCWTHLVARRHPLAHAALALAGCAFLPLTLSLTPELDDGLTSLILAVLASAGVPFFVLSSSAVVASSWWPDEEAPWHLYAVSNAGSLIGLFAYPLVIEPSLGLAAQQWVWSIAYGGFAMLVGLAALQARSRTVAAGTLPAPGLGVRWIALSASASALSLAVATWIGNEFGSFPLLWTLPLGLYLGSFMLAFSETFGRWTEPSGIRRFWPDFLLALSFFSVLVQEPALHPLLYLFYFLTCWATHDALFRLRPAVEGLTGFYLAIAFGGWVGGGLVSIVAPLVFPGLWELPAALLAVAGAMVLVGQQGFFTWFKTVHWRWVVSRVTIAGTLALLTVLGVQYGRRGLVESHRSLHGVFHIRETGVDGARVRTMLHGSTVHGTQYLPPDPRASIPMSYYHPAGGNALALATRTGTRIGGIGLGAGAFAALLEPNETLTVYELDPRAEVLAREWFTYLRPTDRVVIGDARRTLAADDSVYDALFVDAFSGDGIPTHLMTVEALRLYMEHLAPDGILVIHASNRFLDLRGVLRATALEAGLQGVVQFQTQGDVPADSDPLFAPATTVLLARTAPSLPPGDWVRFGPDDPLPRHDPWTDDQINLLQPLFGSSQAE